MEHQIDLFKSLFKAREDVFALRWEKGNKSGYMPAYFYDPYRFRIHKMNGGSLKDFPDKTYLDLTDQEFEKHLKGIQQIGVYPLLKDDTSWFIVADFDKDNWEKNCIKFIQVCEENEIPAYLERSRSGHGGHVWIFYEQPYSAFKARKILKSILQQAGLISDFDVNSSFDRLFPNQDYHTGKGLGNLIALPLCAKTLEIGNSCFVDPATLKPYADQWQFLQSIRRISETKIDQIFSSLEDIKDKYVEVIYGDNKLSIILENEVRINRHALPIQLIEFIRKELNFSNSEYFVKKNAGRNTFGTERYFRLINETTSEIILPRGFIGKLIRYCRENKIEYTFNDRRRKLQEVDFAFHAELRDYQQKVLETLSKKDLGVIVAPPGSGKTLIALKIIADKKQPALIIVHRKQIAEQWIERIEAFLGIPRNEIGKIGHGKKGIGKRITVAMIQSLSKEMESENCIIDAENFGAIIIDECHHIPAETFRNTISKLHTHYIYGLTATPFRKYNDGKLIFTHVGEVIAEIIHENISRNSKAKIIVRNTSLDFPFNPKTDQFETLSKMLIHDTMRNKLIMKDVEIEIKSGKKVVVITERKEHIDSLHQMMKQLFETVTLSGEDTESSRVSKWKILKEGNYDVLITTGQFFGEGSDLQNANCLFLVYPFSFQGKLIQYIGRVQRTEITPVIYDYRDIKIDYLNKMFLKRNTYYNKIIRQTSLFDDPVEDESAIKNSLIIDKEVSIPIEELEFLYGSIGFKWKFSQPELEIDFDIENGDIRPEFEVLKPYFAKTLGTKFIKVKVFAELENGVVISQIATSDDIKRINREVVEMVKFRFVQQRFLFKESTDKESLVLTINQLQQERNGENNLYGTGEDLLNDLLKNKQYKHSKQLHFLAERHSRDNLKLRFILKPFSFLFLMQGNQGFYIVMETLDTEEATYLWSFPNDKRQLPLNLQQIDRDLQIIKTHGRQEFLKSPPENFSRIVHDYSDDKKGFIIWKDMLEERLL